MILAKLQFVELTTRENIAFNDSISRAIKYWICLKYLFFSLYWPKWREYRIIATKGLYYKTLRIRNLQEIDKFRSYLVSFGMDKHTSLDKHKSVNQQKH